MKLTKIGIANFRSIGEEPVMIDLTKKVTVLIGPNNSGKSNVLAAFEMLSARDATRLPVRFSIQQTDYFRREPKPPLLLFHLVVEAEDEVSDSLAPRATLKIEAELSNDSRPTITNDPFPGIPYPIFGRTQRRVLQTYLSGPPNRSELLDLKQKVALRILEQNVLPALPAAIKIPQFRQILAASTYQIAGHGIVELLAAWQHPKIGRDEDFAKFSRIQELLRHLLHAPDVSLEVDDDKTTIIVGRPGLRLPLQSYGTGIHELIILAVAVSSRSNELWCIEEPEIHMHPALQKEFFRFLLEQEGDQFLITTHSAAFIQPSEDVDVIQLSHDGKATRSRRIEDSSHWLAALTDLGIRPSDLLQANAVIWVEGPSDRIYIAAWLTELAPDLVEGVDYAVMFYGGRLLSHLSLERDEPPPELVKLLRIAQNSVVVIDSDMKSSRAKISDTKIRIREECEKNQVYCWITDGREIENYLPEEAIRAAYEEVTGARAKPLEFGRFAALEECLANSYGEGWKRAFSYNDAKPARAHKIAEHLPGKPLDPKLKAHLERIIEVIRDGPILMSETRALGRR